MSVRHPGATVVAGTPAGTAAASAGRTAAAAARVLRARALTANATSADHLASTSTYTSTSIDCAEAADACSCAAFGICGWSTDASGGGRCVLIPEADPSMLLVECEFCPTQGRCPGQGCPGKRTACDCATGEDRCVWQPDFGSCEPDVSGEADTGCLVCPSQPRCVILVPRATSFEPATGGSLEAGYRSVALGVWFSESVSWCSRLAPGSGVAFWCEGLGSQAVSAMKLDLEVSVLRADISDIAHAMVRNGGSNCGLTIEANRICASGTSVPFPGLVQGSYRFVIQDTVPPSLVGFQPGNGMMSVVLNAVVDFVFDEPVSIRSGPQAVATLGKLDSGSFSGAVATLESTQIALSGPSVRTNGTTLSLQLAGMLQPAFFYTLSLPQASVTDHAGNEFVGLLPLAYTFRTTNFVPLSTATLSSGGGPSVLAVVALVSGIAVVIAVIVIATVRFWRGRAHRSYLQQVPSVSPVVLKQVKPARVTTIAPDGDPSPMAGTGEASPQRPSADAGGAASMGERSWGYRASPGAPPYSSRVHPGGGPGVGAASQRAPGGAEAADAAGGGGGASGAGGGHSARPQKQRAPRAPERRQAAAPPPAGAATVGPEQRRPAPTPPVAEELHPNVKAVGQLMRAMMDEPLATRKKALKDLMVEYHPDKNKEPHATEVFQYVNNAKGWFLRE